MSEPEKPARPRKTAPASGRKTKSGPGPEKQRKSSPAAGKQRKSAPSAEKQRKSAPGSGSIAASVPSWVKFAGFLAILSVVMTLSGARNPVSVTADLLGGRGFHPFDPRNKSSFITQDRPDGANTFTSSNSKPGSPSAETPPPADTLDKIFRFAAESAKMRKRETPVNGGVRPDQTHLLVIGYQRIVARNFVERKGLFSMVETEEGLLRTIRGLKARGYTPFTFEKWHRHLVEGGDAPERPVILAFNDGYAEHCHRVLPILRQEGFTGSFFIPTSLVGTRSKGVEHMSWAEVTALSRAGMEICSHSSTHRAMGSMDRNEGLAEMVESRWALTKGCGISAAFFSHPWGNSGENGAGLARKAGYLGTVVTEPARDGLSRKRYVRFYPGRGTDQSASVSSRGPKPRKSS